jgi:hypothetical protein
MGFPLTFCAQDLTTTSTTGLGIVSNAALSTIPCDTRTVAYHPPCFATLATETRAERKTRYRGKRKRVAERRDFWENPTHPVGAAAAANA